MYKSIRSCEQQQQQQQYLGLFKELSFSFSLCYCGDRTPPAAAEAALQLLLREISTSFRISIFSRLFSARLRDGHIVWMRFSSEKNFYVRFFYYFGAGGNSFSFFKPLKRWDDDGNWIQEIESNGCCYVRLFSLTSTCAPPPKCAVIRCFEGTAAAAVVNKWRKIHYNDGKRQIAANDMAWGGVGGGCFPGKTLFYLVVVCCIVSNCPTVSII